MKRFLRPYLENRLSWREKDFVWLLGLEPAWVSESYECDAFLDDETLTALRVITGWSADYAGAFHRQVLDYAMIWAESYGFESGSAVYQNIAVYARRPGESDDDYFERCRPLLKKHARDARSELRERLGMAKVGELGRIQRRKPWASSTKEAFREAVREWRESGSDKRMPIWRFIEDRQKLEARSRGRLRVVGVGVGDFGGA